MEEARISVMRTSKYAGICVVENLLKKLFGCRVETDLFLLCAHFTLLTCSPFFQIGNRVLYIFFTHVTELFGDVVLKPVVRPLRWSNMATMPALPETQENIKEEIRRQVSSSSPAVGVLYSLVFSSLF